MFRWFVDQFERKWNNSAGVVENGPFAAAAAGRPPRHAPPADRATNVPAGSATVAVGRRLLGALVRRLPRHRQRQP